MVLAEVCLARRSQPRHRGQGADLPEGRGVAVAWGNWPAAEEVEPRRRGVAALGPLQRAAGVAALRA